MDQARDVLDLRHMVVSKVPKIVGPTTSINGVFLGPFWYYFNFPAFVFGTGNPAFLVYWNIFWYQLTGLIIWLYFNKKNQVLGVITSVLFLLMPIGFNVTRYVWNANPMPMFTALYLLLTYEIIFNPSRNKKILLGIFSGLFLQVEAAFAIIFLPFSLFILLKQKNGLRNIKYFLFGFLPTLFPQIVFELRHKFVMSKIFINEFSGSSNMLGNKLNFSAKMIDRLVNFRAQLSGTLYLNHNLIILLFVSALIFFVYQNKTNSKKNNKYVNKFFLLSVLFLVMSIVFYLLFPNKLKHWYLFGLATPFVFIFSSFFTQLLKMKNKFLNFLLMILFLVNTFYLVKQHNQIFLNKSFRESDNPSNFANRLNNIDIIYQDAKGQGFKVYSYLPSVYDLPQQYTFWWYATQKYHYQPEELAYLPNQPEYIKDNHLFWKKKKISNGSLTYLIIEHDKNKPQRETDWLNNFNHLCLEETFRLSYQTSIQKRNVCEIGVN